MTGLPLFQHGDASQPVAWRNHQAISAARFLHDVKHLAGQLPERPFVFNLCTDRYFFLLTFCAALLRGQTNLLPPSHAAGTLARLHARFPQSYGVSDKGLALGEMNIIPFPELPALVPETFNIPSIAAGHVATIAFTSGSTGEPQPHPKTWGSLVEQARLEANSLGIRTGQHFLGTVPPQHMYGLESTLMLPLHSGGTLHAGQPLFPADIRQALAELPAPRTLITTPLHLRICLEENMALPPLALIVSAAAPLTAELAQRAENAFGTTVMEFYGCTESGAIAARRTVQDEYWQTMAGVSVSSDSDGQAWVEGGHVAVRTPLQDVIESAPDGTRFRLLGRKADLVNIAGKRASLGDLNRQLGQIPGVKDGIFFAPDDTPGTATRLTALVVAPDLQESEIIAALRQKIDAAFLPRPLHKVESLPRTATGKLPRTTLIALLDELQRA
ncbi:MAG: AMP-binding protein [Sulfuricella sp.]|jgi:acyl-coenzyme A synthetase/AMP-(fatty) acid ligase